MGRPLFSILTFALLCATSDASIAQSYTAAAGKTFDYIIVGGGTAGLALASRLSEEPNVTIAVFEAGGTADDSALQSILMPSGAYYQSLGKTAYDWGYTTVAQPNVGNRQLNWPRGKILGGSSATNGLYLNKGNKVDWDALQALNPGSRWNWENINKYMMKAENYTPPIQENVQNFNITYDLNAHGTTGPIQISYPHYFPSEISAWFPSLNGLGISHPNDVATGDFIGSMISTSSISSSNQTRSYSLNAYIDGTQASNNPNLIIVPGQQVTRILFDSTTPPSQGKNLTAIGVEWASSDSSPRVNTTATREVIICAGAIGSPQILQVSGIGPQDLLSKYNIPTLVNLPGVGQNLQDHIVTKVVFVTDAQTGDELGYNTTFKQEQTDLYTNSKTGFYDYVNNAIAFLSNNVIFNTGAQGLITALQENKAAAVQAVSNDPTIQAGYKTQYDYLMNTVFSGNYGIVEMLYSFSGTGKTGVELVPGYSGTNTISLQVALQRPLSRGSIEITSGNTFDKPNINPNYFSQGLDLAILRQGLKYARQVGSSSPLNTVLQVELTPGTSTQSDADWQTYITQNAGTEFHPCGSCSMLPKNMGGVVDTDLIVYGTNNLRIVDASIIPLVPAAHTTWPVYGLAEMAADIIKSKYNLSITKNTTNFNNDQGTGSTKSSSSSGEKTSQFNIIILFVALFFSLPSFY